MSQGWMIYGASGYTGTLVAEEAVRRGHRPLLAGRSAAKVAPIAERLGLEWVAFALDDRQALADAVARVSLVFHSAGPFVHTAAPMRHACLAAGRHYLDVTGEIPVFAETMAANALARERGIALISGVGFDVVPTDCLAVYLAAQLPDAQTLEVAIATLSSLSAGTTNTALEMLPTGGLVRRQGKLQPYPIGQGLRRIRFSDRERTALPMPWGDLETAYHSTGIPNITTYLAYPAKTAQQLRWGAPVAGLLLSVAPLRRLFQRWISRTVQGPDSAMRARGRSLVWARVANAAGAERQGWLETTEAYHFTAVAGVRAVERVLADGHTGALTPAQAFGPDFVLEIEGTTRLDQPRTP